MFELISNFRISLICLNWPTLARIMDFKVLTSALHAARKWRWGILTHSRRSIIMSLSTLLYFLVRTFLFKMNQSQKSIGLRSRNVGVSCEIEKTPFLANRGHIVAITSTFRAVLAIYIISLHQQQYSMAFLIFLRISKK